MCAPGRIRYDRHQGARFSLTLTAHSGEVEVTITAGAGVTERGP